MNDKKFNIHDVVDYIIVRLDEGGVALSLLKLQKLLFYVQAWRLAFGKGPFFAGSFQAWIHGPVNRDVYDRFKDDFSLYSIVGTSAIKDEKVGEAFTDEERLHIDEVLEAYGCFSGTQLEAMTHSEKPWQAAREGYRPSQRCENLINEELMAAFYKQQLADLERV